MYIANKSFTTTKGKVIRMGDVLTLCEFNQLNTNEKAKIKKKEQIGIENFFNANEEQNKNNLP